MSGISLYLSCYQVIIVCFQAELKKHMVFKHTPPNRVCKQCEIGFKTVEDLKTHDEVSRGQKWHAHCELLYLFSWRVHYYWLSMAFCSCFSQDVHQNQEKLIAFFLPVQVHNIFSSRAHYDFLLLRWCTRTRRGLRVRSAVTRRCLRRSATWRRTCSASTRTRTGTHAPCATRSSLRSASATYTSK